MSDLSKRSLTIPQIFGLRNNQTPALFYVPELFRLTTGFLWIPLWHRDFIWKVQQIVAVIFVLAVDQGDEKTAELIICFL